MAELELELRALAAAVEWPATPELVLPPQLGAARARRRPAFVVVFAAALIAVGVAFALPPARSAILRFFGLGSVRIERVTTLPPATERPLAASLGRPVSGAEAAQLLGRPMRLPPDARGARLYASGPAVSTLLRTSEGALLLSEVRVEPGIFILKKLAAGNTRVEWLSLPGSDGAVWISGARHVVVGPTAPARLAGNVLLWQAGPLTFRLEGKALTRDRAVALARSILGGT